MRTTPPQSSVEPRKPPPFKGAAAVPVSKPALAPLEAAWSGLRAALEWADGFLLVFVFCGDGLAKQALMARAQDLLRARALAVERMDLPRTPAEATPYALAALLRPAEPVRTTMPLWLDWDATGSDWDAARTEFFFRLNERRARLEREQKRLVILVLPEAWTKQAAEAAPDLWTIRLPSVYLPAGSAAAASAPPSQYRPEPTALPQFDKAETAPQDWPLALKRWKPGPDGGFTHLAVYDGIAAAEAAEALGWLQRARDVAQQTVGLAREYFHRASTSASESARPLRDLSVSLEKMGDLAKTLGRLEDAQSAYAEGEALRRQLIAEHGPTPERLRDLSVSLEKMGDLADSLGRLQDAQSAYAEVEALARQRIAEHGPTPQRLRDLSVSLNKLGDLAKTLGRLQDAQSAYAEGEALARQRIAEYGPTPGRLRDLSLSLVRRGNLAKALGRLEDAQTAYAEVEALARQLIAEHGPTPERLRDLSVSLEKLGGLALAQKQPEQAQALFAEGVQNAEQLVAQYGETVTSLEVLAAAHLGLAKATQALARPAAEVAQHAQQARDLFERLSLSMPHETRYAAGLSELDALQSEIESKINVSE